MPQPEAQNDPRDHKDADQRVMTQRLRNRVGPGRAERPKAAKRMAAGVTNEADLGTDDEDEQGTAKTDHRRAQTWLGRARRRVGPRCPAHARDAKADRECC